jgi:hypothetical protein
MVVVQRQNPHHPRRPLQGRVRADEDELRAGSDEPRHEILREPPVDLGGRIRRPLAAVAARVVDVHVEPVLVRGMARPAVGDTKVTAAGAAQVADADARRLRVRAGVLPDDREQDVDQPHTAEAAPPAVRLPP